MLPARIGGYEVTGELGRGGMGAVYRARDPRDGRFVAIDLLLAARGADALRRRRFAREAEALQRSRHAAIVRVLAADEGAGRGERGGGDAAPQGAARALTRRARGPSTRHGARY